MIFGNKVKAKVDMGGGSSESYKKCSNVFKKVLKIFNAGHNECHHKVFKNSNVKEICQKRYRK